MLKKNNIIGVQLSKSEFVHIKTLKPDPKGNPRYEGYYYKFDKTKDWGYGYKEDGKKVIVTGYFKLYEDIAQKIKEETLKQ